MANRCTLHKTKIEQFKEYLDSREIPHRPGVGDYQVLQVRFKLKWHVIYYRDAAKEHYTAVDALVPLVRDFVRSRYCERKLKG